MQSTQPKRPCLFLTREARKRRARLHPWVFSNEIETPQQSIEPGTIVDIAFPGDQEKWTACYNPHSLIAARVLDEGSVEISSDWIAGKLERAYQYRKKLNLQREAWRLVHGEADGLPGLVVDVYGKHLVIQSLTAGMDRLLPLLCENLSQLLMPESILGRMDHELRELEGLDRRIEPLMGTVPEDLKVSCYGVQYQVDTHKGQKTGMYLDQMENIQSVLRYANGAEILDVCCYQGAFALSFLKAGAQRVLAVDISGEALRQVNQNVELNGLTGVEGLEGDAFKVLPELIREKKSFDVVNLDPPPFAKRKKDVESALRGYRELNRRAIKLVKSGGIFCTATCSHHIHPDLFLEMLILAARDSGRMAKVVEIRQQASDHPVLLSAPETRYLTFVILQLD